MDQTTPEIILLLRSMRGSSQAVLAKASDGNFYVIKMPGRTHGPNTLCNEAAAHELYRSFGLPVPESTCVSVSARMIEGNPDCWCAPADVPPDSGLCFASRFVGAESGIAYDLLPGSLMNCVLNREDFWLAWVIDTLSNHNSYRQAVFTGASTAGITAVFIDHCEMFGGSDGSQVSTHLRSQFWDERVYTLPDSSTERLLLQRLRDFNPDRVIRGLERSPAEWQTLSALKEISDALHRLSDYELVRSTFEQLLQSIETQSHARGTEERSSSTGHGVQALRYETALATRIFPRTGGHSCCRSIQD